MKDFYRGPYETAVGEAEMLIEMRIPLRANGSSAYEKVERRGGRLGRCLERAALWLEGDVIADARVGLAAVGPNTTGIPAISEALRGKAPSEEAFAAAGAIAGQTCSPVTDMRGSVEYKRHLANELTQRALRRSVAERSRTGGPKDAGVDDGERPARSQRRSRAACSSSTSCGTSSG